MRITGIILIIVTVVAISGCNTEPICMHAVVGWKREFSIGSFALDIPFTFVSGKQATLHEVREPVAVLVFLTPWTEACFSMRPDLLSIRKRLHVLPITVVQILLPIGECTHVSDCMHVSGLNKYDYDIVSLCDRDRVAWRVYGQPDPNTAILIDQNSMIVDIQNTDNVGTLTDKAYWMGRTIYDRRHGDVGD